VRLRARVARLEHQAACLPPTGRIDFVSCVPAGCPMADNRPVGVYPNAKGNAVQVVYSGADPDREFLASFRSRMPEWGMIVVSH
jgi:hypothetical protein